MRANGLLAADIRPLVRVSVHVIAEQNGRRESGSAGGGARHDYGYFTSDLVNHWVDEAVDSALLNLESRPAPAGPMTVVMGPGWPGATEYPHVARGGSWDDEADILRSGARRASDSSWKMRDPQLPKSKWYLTDAQFLGFRVVRPLKVPPREDFEKYWTSFTPKP